jgi:hypothetical protein
MQPGPALAPRQSALHGHLKRSRNITLLDMNAATIQLGQLLVRPLHPREYEDPVRYWAQIIETITKLLDSGADPSPAVCRYFIQDERTGPRILHWLVDANHTVDFFEGSYKTLYADEALKQKEAQARRIHDPWHNMNSSAGADLN